MGDALSLQYEVADIIGLDAWKIYEKGDTEVEERHLIPEAMMLSIAGSLIGDFLKGLIQPERLGQAARAKLDDLYSNLKHKDFSRSADKSEFIDLLNSVQAPASQTTPEQLQKAEESLAASLREFGLDATAAKDKASQIRASVMASLTEA
jgi:hypothetical protein